MHVLFSLSYYYYYYYYYLNIYLCTKTDAIKIWKGVHYCLCLGHAAASNVAGLQPSVEPSLYNQMLFERSQGSARMSVNWERDFVTGLGVGDILIWVGYRKKDVWSFAEYGCFIVVIICSPVVTICTVEWSLYVPYSGHYMYRRVVTICTVEWSLYVPYSGHYMYRAVVPICTVEWSLYVP